MKKVIDLLQGWEEYLKSLGREATKEETYDWAIVNKAIYGYRSNGALLTSLSAALKKSKFKSAGKRQRLLKKYGFLKDKKL